MKLSKYDNKLIKLVTVDNETFEGICTHNNIDYNESEYGVSEESIDIQCLKFYKSSIKEISIIDKFSSKYGLLEEVISKEGYDLIDEVFTNEDDTHILRELYYLEDHRDLINEKIIKLIKDLIKYNKNEEVIKEANKIIKEYE